MQDGEYLIFLFDCLPGYPAPAAAGQAVGFHIDTFDIPVGGESDQDGFVDGQVLVAEFAHALRHDLGAAFIAVLFAYFQQVFTDDAQDLFGVRQQVFEIGNLFEHFFMLVLDLLAFQGSQPAQLQVKDGLGLGVAQLELRHQALTRNIGIR